MINMLYSFIGCFFALFFHDLIEYATTKVKKPKQTETKVMKRVAPINMGRFADPLGDPAYELYKDERTHLYKTYVPKKANRRGGDINE